MRTRVAPSAIAAKNSPATTATLVYERIRNDILTGKLEPGLKLRIDQVSRKYEVGTSPIREALNRLSADGMVDREEQRGFYVAKVSIQELQELVKTRCWLESIALRESILNANQAWEDALVLAHHRLARTPRSPTEKQFKVNPEWEERHSEFHDALISNCGSSQLFRYCKDLRHKSDRYRLLAAASVSARRELDEHRAIFESVIAGKIDISIELLCSHYDKTRTIIEKRFSTVQHQKKKQG